MKKAKTFVEYEERTHKALVYPSHEAVAYLAEKLVEQAEEVEKEARYLEKYREDINYEALQEKLGKVLLYLTELSKYAVYLDGDSHTSNSALEYIARKSLVQSFIKIKGIR